MTCSGCSGAVDRVLKKTEGACLRCVLASDHSGGLTRCIMSDGCDGAGVSSYDISLEKQEVVVTGTIPYDDLHAKIAKTGKQVRRPRLRSL